MLTSPFSWIRAYLVQRQPDQTGRLRRALRQQVIDYGEEILTLSNWELYKLALECDQQAHAASNHYDELGHDAAKKLASVWREIARIRDSIMETAEAEYFRLFYAEDLLRLGYSSKYIRLIERYWDDVKGSIHIQLGQAAQVGVWGHSESLDKSQIESYLRILQRQKPLVVR